MGQLFHNFKVKWICKPIVMFSVKSSVKCEDEQGHFQNVSTSHGLFLWNILILSYLL